MALWTNKKDIKEEEYNNFYSQLGNYDKPSRLLNKMKNNYFINLLFIPSEKPLIYYTDKSKRKALCRGFITDDCQNLVPKYLRFYIKLS